MEFPTHVSNILFYKNRKRTLSNDSNEIFCYGKKCEFVRSLLYPSSEQSESIPIELNFVKAELPPASRYYFRT